MKEIKSKERRKASVVVLPATKLQYDLKTAVKAVLFDLVDLSRPLNSALKRH